MRRFQTAVGLPAEVTRPHAPLIPGVAFQARTATVHRADGSARLVREHERLEGEDVLPGLVGLAVDPVQRRLVPTDFLLH